MKNQFGLRDLHQFMFHNNLDHNIKTYKEYV